MTFFISTARASGIVVAFPRHVPAADRPRLAATWHIGPAGRLVLIWTPVSVAAEDEAATDTAEVRQPPSLPHAA